MGHWGRQWDIWGERGPALGWAMGHWGESAGPHWGRQWLIGVGKWGCFSVAGRCWGGCVVALG